MLAAGALGGRIMRQWASLKVRCMEESCLLKGVAVREPSAANFEPGADIILAAVVGVHGGAQARHGCGFFNWQALQAIEQGFQKQAGADEGGNGISWQAQDLLLALAAIHEGFARAQGNFPEVNLDAGVFQCLLDEVMIADRGAARGDDDIGLGHLENGALGGFQVVPEQFRS